MAIDYTPAGGQREPTNTPLSFPKKRRLFRAEIKKSEVIREHCQTQPRRIGPEVLCRHDSGRQFVLQHVVYAFNRARFLTMPLDKSAWLSLINVSNYGEVLHLAAVGKQSQIG